MNPSLRRFLALAAVFVVAFTAVSALRAVRTGGGLFDGLPWIGGGAGGNGNRPERFTLPDRAPLDAGDLQLLSRLDEEYSRLTGAVVPSVVSIDTRGVRTELQRDFWGRARELQRPTQGQGSGVIVTREGHVITNHHVISGQEQIQVTLHGGRRYPATLIGEDPLLDIAVLRIEGQGPFTPLKLGDSTQVEVGQLVFAVGNPFGLGETVTQGIISAKERSLSDSQRDLFQTDAAINPGNSGGPLVNLRGEIIGINVAIYSSNRENPSFQGVGFSIPANDVRDALYQILERGRPIRGYVGLQLGDLDAASRGALGVAGGAFVAGVIPGSPAEEAGIRPGDLVLSYDGEEVRGASQLIALVQRTRVGKQVRLGLLRDGGTMNLKVTIGEAAESTVAPETELSLETLREVLLAVGVEARDFTVQERLRGLRGAVITRVAAEGAAAGRLQPGDLVFAVNQRRIQSAYDFFSHLSATVASRETTLDLFRDGQRLQVSLGPVRLEGG